MIPVFVLLFRGLPTQCCVAFHHKSVFSDEKGALDWLGLPQAGGRRLLAAVSGGGIL